MRDLLKQFGSRKRMVQLAFVVAGFVVLGWWVNGRMRAAEARRFKPASEVERIQYAVLNARSWHVSMQGTMHGEPFETEQDVVCPYQSHTITQEQNAAGAKTVVSEIIETQDTMYAREGGQAWSSEPKAGMEKCRMGPMAGASTLSAVLAGLKDARAIGGGVIQSGGQSCQVWNFIASNSDALLATLCVDETSHLPYELKQGLLDVHYANWNMPIEIPVPTVGDVPPQNP